ncbi:hypothetical protein GGD62_007457 [Bradyrhizobium sp. ERR14]|nr:hypothetical protein [Bradyrhizobium sp. ERR14]
MVRGKGIVGTAVASSSAVVPANAGTHNDREKFGEDEVFGTSNLTQPIDHAVGPGVRRDDPGESTVPTAPVIERIDVAR